MPQYGPKRRKPVPAKNRTVANAIGRARSAKSWTQEALADEVKTTGAQVSKWERGEVRPSREMCGRLSRALGIDLGVLVAA